MSRQKSKKKRDAITLNLADPKNPFAESLDLFFRRQVNISGQITIVNYVKTKLTASESKVVRNKDGELVFIEHEFKFSYESNDSKETMRLLRSYLFNTLVAMSVENFETLLNNFVRAIIKDYLGSKMTKHFNYRQRNNKDKIHFISDFVSESSPFDANLFDMFYLMESVRHIVIHQDQNINLSNPQNVVLMQKLDFKNCYSTELLAGNTRIVIDKFQAHHLLRQLTQIGFDIFESLCVKESIKIKYETIAIPPENQPVSSGANH